MTVSEIIKNKEFKEVAELKVDSKKRLALGKTPHPADSYRVYENELGEIVLVPLKTIPASEAWLYENEKALASLRRGLKDAKEGKLTKAKEDFSKYI